LAEWTIAIVVRQAWSNGRPVSDTKGWNFSRQ